MHKCKNLFNNNKLLKIIFITKKYINIYIIKKTKYIYIYIYIYIYERKVKEEKESEKKAEDEEMENSNFEVFFSSQVL